MVFYNLYCFGELVSKWCFTSSFALKNWFQNGVLQVGHLSGLLSIAKLRQCSWNKCRHLGGTDPIKFTQLVKKILGCCNQASQPGVYFSKVRSCSKLAYSVVLATICYIWTELKVGILGTFMLRTGRKIPSLLTPSNFLCKINLKPNYSLTTQIAFILGCQHRRRTNF